VTSADGYIYRTIPEKGHDREGRRWCIRQAGCGGAFFIIFFLLLTLIVPANVPAAEVTAFEDLPTLVATALANNPELKASQARWEMFRSRIDQSSSLEDPMLMLKLQNWVVDEPFNSRVDPMTQRVIGITQQLPFWGKRDLKGEVAAKEAESYRWAVEERRLELARMVKETWYRLYYTDRSRVIVERNIKILDDFITLAETRYSVGRGCSRTSSRPRWSAPGSWTWDNPGTATENPSGESQRPSFRPATPRSALFPILTSGPSLSQARS